MLTKSKHILSFIRMLLSLSFSTRALALLTVCSLLACYLVKELTSQAICHLGSLYNELESKEAALSLKPFILFSLADCCGITLLYWLRPAHSSIAMELVESALMKNCLSMGFEDFYSSGPAKNASRIYRSVSSIRDGTSILIFDLLGNVIVVFSSLKILGGMLETGIFVRFIIALGALAIFQILLFMTLSSLKKQYIEINDARAEEMNGFYENFSLVRTTNTNEHHRMSPFFKSDVFLKYQVLLNSIKFQSSLYFVAINVFVLCSSIQVRSFTFNYLKELALLVTALSGIITNGFELESKRIEVGDMEQKAEPHHCDAGISDNAIGTIQDSYAGSIELADVSIFIRGTPLLQHLNLKIYRTDKIALVGSNGSGKTTFFKFLLGFLKYSGHVHMGHEIVDVSSGMLRKHTSYLSQNRFLDGTVLEVLREEISNDDEVVEMCKKFGAHEFILGLPKGYQTPINESSQAQQQMINVIRAYSKKSSILLADEPVDCFDSPDQGPIVDILLENDHHLTKIIILHSKEHIHKFDRVFVAGEHTIRSYTPREYLAMENGTK